MSTLKTTLTDTDALNTAAANATVPPVVSNYLAKLKVLQNVPFHYLVPRLEMLPEESMRFFEVDSTWLNALLDGAFSIGRASEERLALDTALWPYVLNATNMEARNLRVDSTTTEPSTDDSAFTKITGFILRSTVVSDFPDMELFGYPESSGAADTDNPLTLLRAESLSPSLMIGLFEGDLYQVLFRQPTEGIHFGFDIDDSEENAFFKYARYLEDKTGDSSHQTGKVIEVDGTRQTTDITATYRNVEERTLSVAQLASTLSAHTSELDSEYDGSTYTSAQFGLQMVLGAGYATFTNTAST